MRRASWFSLSFLAVFLLWGAAQADQIRFKADLAPGPGVTSSGKGTATATLDTSNKTLTWMVDYSGLSGPAKAAHIHGPADPGANAGIVVPFTGNLASPIKGSATLTDEQIGQLEAGKWYVNIHTDANKPGEIRGQLVRAS
ncbi:MAG: CHRD domain-containing protein [Stellaceae bacterium]